MVYDFLTRETTDTLAIASTATVYSKSLALPTQEKSFAFFYKATSAGTVNLKLEIEYSWTSEATEGAADDNFVVADSAVEFNDTLGDELLHVVAYAPLAATRMRFKVTGLAGNDASTVLSVLKVVYKG